MRRGPAPPMGRRVAAGEVGLSGATLARLDTPERHMGDNQEAASQTLPPHAQLIQMGTGYWVSGVVYAAAKLGLADQLTTGPKSAAELAGVMTLHATSLHRLMRTLASLGILTERDEQRFALLLGATSTCCRTSSTTGTKSVSDHPGPLPESHQARWPPIDRRDGLACWRHAASGQDAGHGHAGNARWPRTYRSRIRIPAGQIRFPPEPSSAHGVGCERGGSSSGLN